MNKITTKELQDMFGDNLPIAAFRLIAEPGILGVEMVRARLREIAAAERQQDDSDLVEAALRVIARSGRLVLRREIYINGIRHDPAIYALQHLGPAPQGESF